ncbi:MAG: hypothetical protein PHP08_00020 [Candidatus Dojkabacteria bacterium]|nr:hypothetical protein [Candidatus Dojkabacteria bacterium]
MEQLQCKICKVNRELTEEEIKEATEIISKRNLDSNTILKIWSVFDGKTCSDGGNHEYKWNSDFFNKMTDDSLKIKDSEIEIAQNTNENKDLEKKIERLKIDTENKINEMSDKIDKNKQRNIEIEQSNKDLSENILKISGRIWKEWL